LVADLNWDFVAILKKFLKIRDEHIGVCETEGLVRFIRRYAVGHVTHINSHAASVQPTPAYTTIVYCILYKGD